MGKKAKELGALAVGKINTPGLHFVGGVGGLGLQVMPSGSRQWILRVVIAGKRRDMGLGGFPDVTLAGAREAAREARAKIKSGIDPIEESRSARSALAAARAAAKTFAECATAYIDAHESEWKNPKHLSQWRNTIEQYANPVIGKLLVRDVEQSHIQKILEPIWKTKAETASRLRGRMEKVLDWATVAKFRTGDNPARWKGHLEVLLAASGKKVEHHPALPYADIGNFMVDLRKQAGTGAQALEFAILCASRSGEVRGATWDEIDMEEAVWTIPGTRMKMEREHRVPLSTDAVKLLKSLPRLTDTNLVFPNSKGAALSDMALTAVLRRMKRGDITVHGFRSTFRDWAAENTNYPRDVAEMALAHAIGDKVEAAYRRGDLFEKRRRMMKEWGKFCGTVVRESATVTTIKRKLVA